MRVNHADCHVVEFRYWRTLGGFSLSGRVIVSLPAIRDYAATGSKRWNRPSRLGAMKPSRHTVKACLRLGSQRFATLAACSLRGSGQASQTFSHQEGQEQFPFGVAVMIPWPFHALNISIGFVACDLHFGLRCSHLRWFHRVPA